MMKKSIYTISVCLAAVAMSLAVRDDSVSLKRVNKVGDAAKYKMAGHMSVGGGDADYAATLATKVAKVESDGGFTLTTATSDVKITFGGQDMTPPDQPDQTVVFAANGDVVSISGGQDAGPDTYRFENLNNFSYPDKPVKVGDSWSKDRVENKKTGATAVHSEYKVAAREKVDAYDTLKITFTTKETGTDGASISGTAWINVADGTMVKTDVKWTGVPVPGAPGPVDGTVTMTRIG